MFFHLTGIKDISEKNYTLELLIEAEDVAAVKNFLSEQKVIILGLEHYSAEPKDFWDVYLDVQSKSGIFRVIGQLEKLEDFVSYVVKLKLPIIDANYFSHPLASDKVQDLLRKALQEQEASERSLQIAKEKEEKKKNLNFNDKKLKKAYEAIDQVINQIDQLLEIGGKNILPTMQKKMDDMRGEISKLRLATNYDKIIEELHKTMNLIVEVQDSLLERLESDKIFVIVPQSRVTNVEVIREQTRLAKANLLSALGAQLSREETMYVSLGYLKLFTQYLRKDIEFVGQNRLLFAQKIFQGLELALWFLLLEVALIAVFAQPLWITLTLQRFGVIFIYIALAALLFRFANEYLRPKVLLHYLWIFLGIVLLYIALLSFVKFILVF